MTTKDIERALIAYEERAHIVSCRASMPWECDVLSVSKAGYATEYEIKRCRSDFKADFKKLKHKHFTKRIKTKIAYFTFVCPADLIKIDEVPDYAGLIYIYATTHGYRVVQKKKPKRLFSKKISKGDETRLYRSMMYRWLKIQ